MNRIIKFIKKIMATITVNDKSYTSTSINIRNSRIIVNGVDVTPDSKVINISITGDVQEVDVDMCDKISITGNATTVRTTSGDIFIEGSVQNGVASTSGDVRSGNIGGSVQTVSGDVNCGTISGSVKTVSGDVYNKK